jgi:hemolysin activation/secretion protein
VVEFSQDYLKRDARGVWGAESKFRLGTGLFNATSNPGSQADGQFFSWQGQVQRLHIFSPDSQLLVRGTLQLTPDSLLGAEQFFVGGLQSVRGYYQNQRFGDNGFSLSVENQLTLLDQPDGQPLLRLLPFVDLGYVWNSRSNTLVSNQNFLLGTGLGVETYPLDNLKTRLDFGIPLVTVNDLPGDPPSGLRVYFDIRYQF